LPLEGKAGEYVKIYGSAFGSDKNKIKVFFGDLQADIESMSTDRLVVKIPAYSKSESLAIFVERNGERSQAIGNFKLVGPEILKITPDAGMGDVTLIIDGRNFSTVPWRNVVKIGPYSTEIVNASANQLTVKFDTRIFIPGQYELTVSVEEIGSEEENFTVETPWKMVKSKPEGGLCQTAQFEIKGKIYICTGIPVSWNTNVYSTQVWQYDIVSDTWTRKKDFPGAGRVDATAFALNGKGYLASGYSTQPESDFWEYDPEADSWTEKASIPNGAKIFASSFAFDGKGYLIMMGAFQMQNEFWQYAPLTNQWTRLDDFPGSSRVYGKLFVFNNALYVAGGYNSVLPFNPDIWKYNFTTQDWQSIGEINFSVEAIYVFDNKVFALSADQDYFGNFELRHFEYDPDANTKGNHQYYFAGAYRNYLGLSVVYGNSVYIGLGTEFGSNDCLSDTWKLELQ
jgi:N-acetylneuraminic acid mutarotase